MPTYEGLARFYRDFARLTRAQRLAFLAAVKRFVPDLEAGRMRAGLRVKSVQGTSGVYEMTWAPDGRATFQYGRPVKPGHPHIVWRRVGSHDVLREP